MLDKNNLIIIYGKAGNYKSSLGISLLNELDKNCCYVNLDGNSHLKVNNNIRVYTSEEITDICSIKRCINQHDVTLVDYLELLKYEKEDLVELKDLSKKNNKVLIIITGCSVNKDLMNNNKHYDMIKDIADLVIIMDK